MIRLEVKTAAKVRARLRVVLADEVFARRAVRQLMACSRGRGADLRVEPLAAVPPYMASLLELLTPGQSKKARRVRNGTKFRLLGAGKGR